MPLIATLPRGRVASLDHTPTSMTVQKHDGNRFWNKMKDAVGGDVAAVEADAVCRQEELPERLAKDVAARTEKGADSSIVFYEFDGKAADSKVLGFSNTLLLHLQKAVKRVEEAQEAEKQLDDIEAEEQLPTEKILNRKRQSTLGAGFGTLAADSLPKEPCPFGAMVPSPPEESIPPTSARTGMSRFAFGDDFSSMASARSSKASEYHEMKRRHTVAALLARKSSFKGSTQLPQGSVVVSRDPRAAPPRPAALRRRSSFTQALREEVTANRADVPRIPDADTFAAPAPKPTGITSLGSRQGTSGDAQVATFTSANAHFTLDEMYDFGEHVAALGVDMWVRSNEGQKRQTLIQLMGHKMEMVQIIVNQDIEHHEAPGMLYAKVRDQLYNDLEIMADTNDLLTDGRWHCLQLRVVDLKDDKMSFLLDGVELRVRIGSHACPYKFEGWGKEEAVFGCIGKEGVARSDPSMKSYPFRGCMTELTIWGGDRVLHHWSLKPTPHQRSVVAHDAQRGAEARPSDEVVWEAAAFPETCIDFCSTSYINCGTLGSFGKKLSGAAAIDLWFKLKPAAPDEPVQAMTLLGVTDTALKQQQLQIVANMDERGVVREGSIMFGVTDAAGKRMTAAIHGVIVPGQWHHLLWVICDIANHSFRVEFDKHAVEIALGVLEFPKKFVEFTSWIALGAHNNRGTVQHGLNGSVKSVKIWAGKGRGKRLVVHYKIDEGPGTAVVMDRTGQGYNGVIGRVPPSHAKAQLARRGSSFRLRRRASDVRLENASDLSFKYAKWMGGEQPITNDEEIEAEMAQQQRLYEYAQTKPKGGGGQNLRLAVLEVVGEEDASSDGQVREKVIDCLHEGFTDLWKRPERQEDAFCGGEDDGPPRDVIPSSCWEDVSSESIHLALERAMRYHALHRRTGHMILCLWIGQVRVTLLFLQGRPASHHVSVTGGNALQWSGPVQFAGADAKQKHVLHKGLAGVEHYFCKYGCGRLAKAPLRASAVAELLHSSRVRHEAPVECHVVFQPETFDHVRVCGVLVDAFRTGEKCEAAKIIQTLQRGRVAKKRYRERAARQAQLLAKARHLEAKTTRRISARYFAALAQYVR